MDLPSLERLAHGDVAFALYPIDFDVWFQRHSGNGSSRNQPAAAHRNDWGIQIRKIRQHLQSHQFPDRL